MKDKTEYRVETNGRPIGIDQHGINELTNAANEIIEYAKMNVFDVESLFEKLGHVEGVKIKKSKKAYYGLSLGTYRVLKKTMDGITTTYSRVRIKNKWWTPIVKKEVESENKHWRFDFDNRAREKILSTRYGIDLPEKYRIFYSMQKHMPICKDNVPPIDNLDSDHIQPGELLYGFAAWVTTMSPQAILSAYSADVSYMVYLLEIFLWVNGISSPTTKEWGGIRSAYKPDEKNIFKGVNVGKQ